MKKGILTSLILKWNSISRLICLLLTVVIFSTGINVPAFAKNPASQTDLEAVETQEVTDEDTDNPGDAGDDSGDTKKDLNDLNPEADPAPETTNQDPADSEKDLKEPEKEKTEENAQPESNPESELHSENIESGSVKGPQKSTEPNPEEIADDKEQEKVPVDCTAVINDVINGTLQDASKPYRIRLTVKNTAPILLRANAEFAFTLRVTDEDSGHAFTYEGKEINPETGSYEIEDTRYFKGGCDHLLEIESVDGKSTGSFQISILKPQKEDSDETNEQNDDEDDDEDDDEEDDTNQKDDPETEPEENQEDSEQIGVLKSNIPDLKGIKKNDDFKSEFDEKKDIIPTEDFGGMKEGNNSSDSDQTVGGTYTLSIHNSEIYTITISNSSGTVTSGTVINDGETLNVSVSIGENYVLSGYLLESIKIEFSNPEGTIFFNGFTPNYGNYTGSFKIENPNGTSSDNTLVTISAVIKAQKTYTIKIEWENESNEISNDDYLPTGIGVQTRKSSTNDSWINLDVLAEKKDYSYSEWTYTHTYYPDDPYDVRFVEIDSSGSRIDPDSQTIALFNVNVDTGDEDPTPSRAFYEVSYTTPYENDSLKTLITNTLSTSERTLKVNFTDEGNEEEQPEQIKAVLQYKKSNGQWITIKQQDVSNSNNWKATFSGVPKLASTSSNDPIRIRLVNDAGGLVYDHYGTNKDTDDPNPDDNDKEAFFNSVQGDDSFPAEECSVTYHDVDYVRTNSGAGIPSYYPGRMRASGNALRDGGGGGAGNEEQVNLGGQQVTLRFRTEIDWGNDIIGVPDPVTVQLQKQDQPNGNWSVIQSHVFNNASNWEHRFTVVVNQIANDYRVRELDRTDNAVEPDGTGLFDINSENGKNQVLYKVKYAVQNQNQTQKKFTITNTKDQKYSAQIIWALDDEEQFESDPIYAVLQCKKNGKWEIADTQILSSGNNWKAVFDEDPEPGVEYRVREMENVQGTEVIENNGDTVTLHGQDKHDQYVDLPFKVYYTKEANGLTTITNTRKEAKIYSVEINWPDDAQFTSKDPVEVVLQKREAGVWTDVEKKTLSGNNNWQAEFTASVRQDVQYRIREKENAGEKQIIVNNGENATLYVTKNGQQQKEAARFSVGYAENGNGLTTITNTLAAAGEQKKYQVVMFWWVPTGAYDNVPLPESVKVVLQRKRNGAEWQTIKTVTIYQNEQNSAAQWQAEIPFTAGGEGDEYRVRQLNADGELVDDDNYNRMWYKAADAEGNLCTIYPYMSSYIDVADPDSVYAGITRIENLDPREKATARIVWDNDFGQEKRPDHFNLREEYWDPDEKAWIDRSGDDIPVTLSDQNNWTKTVEHMYNIVIWNEETVVKKAKVKDEQGNVVKDEQGNDKIETKEEVFEIPTYKRVKSRFRLADDQENHIDENGKLEAGSGVWQVNYEVIDQYHTDIHVKLAGGAYSVKKVWRNNNISGYIPDSVTARLQGCKNPNGNGEWETIQDIPLNRDNNWEAKFNQVDIYADYKKFRVREIDGQDKIILIDTDHDYNSNDADANKATFVCDGQVNVTYQKVSYIEDDNGLTTITNEQPAGGVRYHAKIDWTDFDAEFKSKEPITAVLQKKVNNQWVEQKRVTLSSENNWEADFEAVQSNQGDQFRIREEENGGGGNNLIMEEEDIARLRMTRKDENEVKNVIYRVRYEEDVLTTTINNRIVGDGYSEVNVTVYWRDKRNEQHIRPESVTVRLKRNNADTDQTVVIRKNDNNEWRGTFKDLPVRDDQNKLIKYSYDVVKDNVITGEDGKDTYRYTIKENADGYFDLNLYHTPKATVSGHVTWEETGAATEAERPGSVEIKLTAPGQDSQTTTAKASDNWNYQFDNLRKYDDNNEQITYSVSGAKADGYTTTQQGYNFHNKKHRDKEDNEEQQEHQPENPDVNVPGENVPGGGAAAVTGIWKKIAIGVGIAAGIGAITGIIKGITDTGNNNTPSTARITVSGQVKWKNVYRDEDYPDHVTIRLLADGVPTDDLAYIEKQNRGPDDWTFRFDNLYEVDQETGKKIQYSVRQDPLDNFITEITTSDGKTIFTNTYQKNYTSLPVGVIWDDLNNNDGCRPESVTVTVSGHNEVLNEGNDWNAIINGLPVGETLTPEISRTTVITGTDEPGTYKISRPERNEGKEDIKAGEFFILTHTPETIRISGTVAWDDDNNRDGLRSEQVELQLICKHPDKDETINLGSQYRATVTNEDNWEFHFDSAPKYYVGKEIVYSVEEDEIENYTPSYTTENNGGVTITITNSHTPETITINGTITWVDDNNPNRPANVTINLLANDQETNQFVTVTADQADQAGRWQFSFTGLPKNENGQAIKYNITEEPIENYCIAIRGFEVTNTIENYEICLEPGVEGTDEFTDPDTAGTEPDPQKVYMSPEQPGSFRYAPELCLDMSLMDRATRDGYVLNGWYNRNNMKWTDRTTVRHEYCDPDSQNATNHTHKITLTARWKPRNAIIQYALPGETVWKDGEEPASENVALNGTVQLRAKKDAIQLGEGKIFKGWQDTRGYLYQPGDSFQYTGIDQVSKFGRNTPANNPNIIILTAKIEDNSSSQQTEPNKGTLIFDSQGGTVIEPMTVNYDVEITTTMIESWINEKTGKKKPVRASYIFAGWHTQDTGYYPVDDNPIIFSTGNTQATVYAHWTPVNYKLTFNLDNSDTPVRKGNIQWLAYLAPLTNASNPAENVDAPYVINETEKKDETGHYTFAGWNPSLPEAMPAYDLKVNAMWEPTIYRIYLIRKNDNGQTVRKTITGTYGSTVTAPNDPVRADAVFIGWKKQKKSGNEADTWGLPATMEDDNPTYEAQWRETPDAPEAEAGDMNSILVTVEEGQEYSIRVKDGEWGEWVQPDEHGRVVFTGLASGTTYEICTRYAAVAADNANGIPEFPASKASQPTSVTLKEEQDAPVPPMLKAGLHSIEVIAPKTGLLYRINIEDAEWTDWVEPDQDGKVVFTGLMEDTLYTVQTKLKPTRKKNESAPSFSDIYTRKLLTDEVTIGGKALFGRVLTASYEPADAQGVTWQWYRDGVAIDGATEDWYTVTEADREHIISVKATQHVNSTDEDNTIVQTAGKVPLAGEIQITMDNKDVLPIQLTEPADETILDIAEACHLGAKQAQLEGDKIELRVVIRKLNEADISVADRKAIQDAMTAKAANAEVLSYMDITVWLVIGDYEKQITNLGNHSLTLTLTVPEKDRKQNRIFLIAQAHDNKGSILSMSEENSIPFTSALFSTYALGALDKVTITFDTDGGNNIEPITQLCGTEVTPPANPTKEGNDFIRWDPEIPKVMPEKDMAVKAIWQPRIYYIILKLDNDTTRGIRIEKAYGTKINVADPANEGDLVFIGWKKENGSGEEDWGLPTYMEDDNPTYTAQWLGKPEAEADGDTAIRVTVEAGKEYSIDEGESWGIPEGGIYSGLDKGIYTVITRYQATGTREASIASQPMIVILGPEETKVLRSPSLKSDRFSVEVSGPIRSQKYSIDNGSTWKIPDENGQVIFTGLDEDKLYTVQTTWADSQTQNETEILSASIYTKKLLIEEVKITGKALFSRTLTASYEPEGAKVDEWQWYRDGTAIDGATGNEYTITEADCEHTLSVKATQRVNRINEYNIIVKEAGRVPQPGKIQIVLENSDELPVQLITPENGKILNIAEAKHSGAKEAQLEGKKIELRVVIRKLDEAVVSTGDRKVIQEVLKANADDIRILSYMDITVWLIIDDKEAEKEQITDLGEYPLTLKMNVPEKERRTGKYFFIARAHNNKGSILTKSKEDSIPFTSALFSTFALGVSDLITITFDTDGGSEIAPIMQKYGTAVTKPANPTKEGYSFTGWDPEIPETMPAEDLTIKAKWKINRYTITFDTDGGNKITPITLDYGTAVTKPANPTKEGYTFTGWDPEIPETMPAEDLTIKAKWKINRYTITFDMDGGNKINPITLDYGTKITKPANPTKSGYTFMGWSPEIPDKMPARNLTVKAQWKQADNKSVNTGDDSNMALWIAILVLLVAGLAGFNIYQMKKRRKNH